MKIKQYIGETHGALPGIPSTGAYESALSQAAAGINEITKGLQAIGKVGEDIYKRHQETKRENDLQAMQIETEKDWLTFKTGYDRSNPDPMNYAKDVEKGWDEIVKKRSGMTKDGIVSNAFKNKMNARKIMILAQSHDEGERRFHDQYFVESISNVDEWANLAANAENIEDAETFKQDMLGEIHKGYPFTDKYAGELETSKLNYIKTERAKNAEGRVYQDILRDPGGTMQKLMLPPEAGQYPDITEPTKREALRVHAQNIYKVKQTEVEQAAAKLKTENHDREELDIGSLYATGRLSINQIQKAQFLSGDERYTWTARIEAKQRAGVIKTNFGTYARIQDMIFSGQSHKENVKQIGLATEKDLTEQDAETLLNKSTAYRGHVQDHWTKKGYEFLKSKFVTKRDMLGRLLETPEETERYIMGTSLLDIEIANSTRKGKPLEGVEIYNKSVEIWGGLKKSPAELLEEKIKPVKEMKKEREAAETLKKKGGKPEPTPEMPKILPLRNKDESYEDYLKRITGKK